MKLGRRRRGTADGPLSKRALLQHVNRELWTFAADESELALYCECGHDECTASLAVTRDAFAATRVHGACALVVPGHKGIFEPVLARYPGFLVVADLDAVETTIREEPLEPATDELTGPVDEPPAA